MMKNRVVSIGFLAILVISAMILPVSADDMLVGRAILPAETFASGPTSGQFIGAGPINGVIPPFIDKQPVQGFSAVLKKDDGSFYVMSDNGFGAQGNSQDYVLRIYEVQPDFETAVDGSGTIAVDGFISLHDPDGLIPFTIIADLEYYPAEGTAPKGRSMMEASGLAMSSVLSCCMWMQMARY
jgi:glycerophosphoryl diester phosphodiesterase